MNRKLFALCMTVGMLVTASVIAVVNFWPESKPKVEKVVPLKADWTPLQMWELVGDLTPATSMTVPFRGKSYECVVFSDSDIQYGNPKVVLQVCFDRPTLKHLVAVSPPKVDEVP